MVVIYYFRERFVPRSSTAAVFVLRNVPRTGASHLHHLHHHHHQAGEGKGGKWGRGGGCAGTSVDFCFVLKKAEVESKVPAT